MKLYLKRIIILISLISLLVVTSIYPKAIRDKDYGFSLTLPETSNSDASWNLSTYNEGGAKVYYITNNDDAAVNIFIHARAKGNINTYEAAKAYHEKNVLKKLSFKTDKSVMKYKADEELYAYFRGMKNFDNAYFVGYNATFENTEGKELKNDIPMTIDVVFIIKKNVLITITFITYFGNMKYTGEYYENILDSFKVL